MCTSTPLSMYSTNTRPPILLPSQESNETSFHSVLSQNVPELPNNSTQKCVPKKKIYHFIIFLGQFSCLSLLIFIWLHKKGYLKFSGALESNINIPSVGKLNLSLQTEEVLNFTSKIGLTSNFSKLGSRESPPLELWDQIYMNV